MSNEVYANGRAVACKSGDGKVIAAAPDVCLSPPSPPAGPLPVPYPVSSFSSDCSSGSKTVKISGKEIMLKDKSYFKKCTGDEAATKSLGQGVITHTLGGKVYFVAWSNDVQVEGENVVRHLDMTTSNHASPMANEQAPAVETEKQTLPEDCAKLKEALQNEVDTVIPAWMTEDADVAAAATFSPTGSPPTQVFLGSAHLAEKKIVRGKKFNKYSKGVKRGQKSNVVTCDGKPFEYSQQGRPKEGHAESKIIEDLFKSGRPSGKLLIATTPLPPCPDCSRLIREVQYNSSGEKCPDLEIEVCA